MIDNAAMDDMVEFTSDVMDHCRSEAQHATEIVMGALNYLTKEDAGEFQASIQTLQESMNDSEVEEHLQPLKQIVTVLEQGVLESSDRQQMIAAIVQQLQFQDYVSQQMNVLVQMLKFWLETRANLVSENKMPEGQLSDFGNALLGMTVSETEKAIIQQHIPGVEIQADEPEEVDDFLF